MMREARNSRNDFFIFGVYRVTGPHTAKRGDADKYVVLIAHSLALPTCSVQSAAQFCSSRECHGSDTSRSLRNRNRKDRMSMLFLMRNFLSQVPLGSRRAAGGGARHRHSARTRVMRGETQPTTIDQSSTESESRALATINATAAAFSSSPLLSCAALQARSPPGFSALPLGW